MTKSERLLTSFTWYLFLFYAQWLFQDEFVGYLLSTGNLFFVYHLLYHSVKKEFRFSSQTRSQRRLDSNRVVTSPSTFLSLGCIDLGQKLGWFDLLALLTRVCDHRLRIGVFDYQWLLLGFNILLPGCCLTEYIKFEDNITIVRSNDGWVFSLRRKLYPSWACQYAPLYLGWLELYVSKLLPRLCLRFSTNSGIGSLRFYHNFTCYSIFLLDWLQT